MQDYSFLLAIAGVLLAGAVSPGPSFIVVAHNTIAYSRANGLASSLGTASGVCLFSILAAYGISALLQAVPALYWLIKLLGGVCLIYFAVRIWLAANTPLEDSTNSQGGSSRSLWHSYLLGLGTQLSNPKAVLVIASIFIAFIPSSPPAYTVLLISITTFLVDFSWYSFVVLILSTPKLKSLYRNSKAYCDKVIAFCLVVVAMRLILSEII